MDEVFGPSNFLGQITWQHSVQGKNDAKTISLHHNYLVAYRNNPDFQIGSVAREERHNVHYANPDGDPRGLWRSGDVRSPNYRENLCYEVETPSGKIIKAPAKGWRWSKETFFEKVSTGEITFVNADTRVLRKIYLSEQEGRVPESIWFGEECGTTREASEELKSIFSGATFATPKPTRLLERVLQIASSPGDLVLDSFAGSGTTGHAVLKLNQAAPQETPRKFILVEMEPKIAREVTAERVRRVAQGYVNAKGEKVEALGGGFRFCELGEPLFDDGGKIRESVRFGELARHVFFTETGEPLPRERVPNTPFLAECHGVGIYLLYNGILGDKSASGGNVLTRGVLAQLPKFDGPKVIYCAGCLLGKDRLQAERILVRQTPYEIKVA